MYAKKLDTCFSNRYKWNEQIPRKTLTNKTESSLEEIDDQNRPITSEEIELVIKKKKNYSKRKAQAQMASLLNSTKHLKKNEYRNFTNLPQNRRGWILPNTFCEASITLIANQRHEKKTTD